MKERKDVVIADSLAEVAEMQRNGYICHALCKKGECSFSLDSSSLVFAEGDCLIIPQQTLRFNLLSQSDDFAVEVIYVTYEFAQVATPQNNYGMRGHLALFENPVMHLTETQQKVCALNFNYIRKRLTFDTHHFHRDVMINAVQAMMLDFFDFHVELYGDIQVSNQNAQLMQQFMTMLESGDFRQNREVGYYADKLCVTPKYLSEVSKKISGQSANYWITRYTALEISRLLRDRSLTLTEISDMFGFSSLSHFNRYVQNNLSAKPSDFRE